MAEGLVNYTRLDDPEDITVHTQGRPMSPYDEVRLVDEDDVEVAPGEVGELLTRGPYTIRGYYKADKHNEKLYHRRFLSNGGSGEHDAFRISGNRRPFEGSDKPRGRQDCGRGGRESSACPSERSRRAVVAMLDEYLGERTCAFVIVHDAAVSGNELKAFLRNRGLARTKSRIGWSLWIPSRTRVSVR